MGNPETFTLLFVSLHPTLQIIKMEYRKIGDNYYIQFDPETGTGFWDFK